MPYTNSHATFIYETIVEYVNTPSFGDKYFLDIIGMLDYDAICAINVEGSTLLHSTLILAGANPNKCCFVISALVRQAMRIDKTISDDGKKNATRILLSYNNLYGQSPYYQALHSHADPEIINTISEWLSFSVRHKFMSTNQYAKIHKNLDNLRLLACGHHATELQICLLELETARERHWIDEQFYQNIFLSFESGRESLFDIALQSRCNKTIGLISEIINIEILKQNKLGDTIIHQLVYECKTQQLESLLVKLCISMSSEALSSEIIPIILLRSNSSGYRLLDKAIPNCYKIIKHVLDFAYISFKNQWITSEQYNDFLIGHEQYEDGFSPLHEVLRHSDYMSTVLYVNNILKAIIDKAIEPDQFRALLTQVNSCGYSPMQQAINNDSLDKTIFFVYLFKCMFSQSTYDNAILSLSVNRKKVLCRSTKSDANQINLFIRYERELAIYRRNKVQGFFAQSRYAILPYNTGEFLSLINNVIALEKPTVANTSPSTDGFDISPYRMLF